MALIQLILSLTVLGILYKRMLKLKMPQTFGRAQALVPIGLGLLSTMLSFIFFLGIGVLLYALGISFSKTLALPHSLASAFFSAAFPEEIAKFLMIWLSLLLFRSKINNVYDYILIGAAVGMGFTFFEEFIYGGESLAVRIGRLLVLGRHMSFNIIMANHLALAKFGKLHGGEDVTIEYVKAFLIPILLHTVYDAATADNYLIKSSNDVVAVIGIIFAFVAILTLFIFQIRVFQSVKRDAEKYCQMDLLS